MSDLPVKQETEDSTKENKNTEPVFAVPAPKVNPVNMEKQEEAKLKAKYPDLGRGRGASALAQKRLSKGTRYFDSGDYNMAKSKLGHGGQHKSPLGIPANDPAVATPSGLAAATTGEDHPTPQRIQQCRKPSIVSKLAADHMLS